MTQEEKQLLLKDLCGRLPYKTICKQVIDGETLDCELSVGALGLLQYDAMEIKPYLRPMSSMTEEEEIYYNTIYTTLNFYEKEDWLNEHYFDYRIVPSTGKTLIKSGIAIEAPKDMYKID